MELSTRSSISLTGTDGLAALGDGLIVDDPQAFRIEGTVYGFGDVEVVDATMSALRFDSARGTLQFAQSGWISVVFLLQGIAHVHTDAGEAVFIPGSAAVLPDQNLPSLSLVGGARIVFVTLPATALTRAGAVLPPRASAVSAGIVRADPMLAFLQALISTVQTHSVAVHPTSNIVVTLLAGLLHADRLSDSDDFLTVGEEMRRVIAEHAGNPRFDAKALVGHLGFTRRQLDTQFEHPSFSEYATALIHASRLVLAMELLRPESRLTVAKIAERSGFRTRGQLERAVAEVYGIDASSMLDSRQQRGEHPTRDDGRPQQRLRQYRKPR